MAKPGSPSSGTGAGSSITGPTPCVCTVTISPNPQSGQKSWTDRNSLACYVSEPNKTLTTTVTPSGGTFKWTSSDESILKLSGQGSSVTVKGLDEGNVLVKVTYASSCGTCSDTVIVAVKYEIRHILVAQGIQFNNVQLAREPGINRRGDEQIPTGFLSDQLSTAAPFPLQFSLSSATFKSVNQGVKYTIEVTTDRSKFKEKLQTPGNEGTLELEYWHVIYDGHSRYGRGACFGTDDSPGEDWENSSTPTAGSDGLFRMGYRFVGVPALDILHHGYTTDAVSVKVDAPSSDREYKGSLKATTIADLKHETQNYIDNLISTKRFGDFSELELRHLSSNVGSLDTHLRIVGDTVPMVSLGAALGPQDKFWGYQSGEGPAVLLQAGWKGTVCAPLDLDATDLKCRAFCHLGCESYMHYREVLRAQRNWKKAGSTDRFAYFTSDLSVSITGPFWLYYLLTYDQFNAGRPWEPSLEYARTKTNDKIKIWCRTWNSAHPRDVIRAYEIW